VCPAGAKLRVEAPKLLEIEGMGNGREEGNVSLPADYGVWGLITTRKPS